MNAQTGALVVERVLPASPGEVFDAWTTPSRMATWMSPVGAAEAEVDLRVGGSFRVVMVEAQLEHRGEYLEIDPPKRIVNTETFDVEPFNQLEPALVTTTLEEVEGGTKLRSSTRFPSAEALEGALATGMTGGAIESWDRLDEVIASL